MFGPKQIGDVQQLLGLLAQCFADCRMAMAERGNCKPREQVEVLLALKIPEPRALAANKLHRGWPIGGHQGAVLEFF